MISKSEVRRARILTLHPLYSKFSCRPLVGDTVPEIFQCLWLTQTGSMMVEICSFADQLPRTTMSAESKGVGTRLLSHVFEIAANEKGCGLLHIWSAAWQAWVYQPLQVRIKKVSHTSIDVWGMCIDSSYRARAKPIGLEITGESSTPTKHRKRQRRTRRLDS